VAVSGAGPTLVAMVLRGGSDAVAAAVERAYAAEGIACSTHRAGVDLSGARVIP